MDFTPSRPTVKARVDEECAEGITNDEPTSCDDPNLHDVGKFNKFEVCDEPSLSVQNDNAPQTRSKKLMGQANVDLGRTNINDSS
ncbi:unnamed protein product [Microthlaspi erraticum]|uniref:Uncharacterized protein n=1 Tax=Microthlaspi erraticum TaxID=1685480 RepID=A0A6D2KAI9_9BRAS|nr:unnamed protein product [Microthlaspi erraticum]